jgi:hypothetical protein
MSRQSVTTALTIACGLVSLTSCSGEREAVSTSPVFEGSGASIAASSTPPSSVIHRQGGLGDVRHLTWGTVTPLKVNRPVTAAQVASANMSIDLLIRTCIIGTDERKKLVPLTWRDWGLGDRRGRTYPSFSSTPAGGTELVYSADHGAIAIGHCAEAWLSFPVPDSMRVASVEYHPPGADASSWDVG